MTQLSLDANKPQLRPLREFPASLPASNGMPNGPWSGVPLWRGLDPDFLCAPSIPKAPLPPRVKIEMVGRSLRISDETDQRLLALGDYSRGPEILKRSLGPQNKLLAICASIGFLGGIIVAWLLGALR